MPSSSDRMARLILENATDFAIFTTDLDGSITSWNPGAEKLLGWSEREAVGRNACMIFTPEDQTRAACDAEMRTAREAGRAEDERWHMRKDGSRFWSSGLMMRFEDETTGEHIGYLKILRDRTEQREAREREHRALAESEARFRNIADHAPVMMWVTDPSGHCTYLNRRWCEFTGQSEAEAEGFGWLDATHPDDRTAVERAFLAANAAREAFRVEFRLRRADGRYLWVIDAASPRFGASGEFLGYVGSVIDIHERREAEERSRESEARLRILADNLPSGMVYQIAMRMDGSQRRFVYVSQSSERLFGVAAMEALADPRALYDTILPEHRDALAAAEQAAIASLTPFDHETPFRRADGPVRWGRIISAPRRAPDGTLVWDGLFIDISDRRAAEDRLRDSEEQLRRLADALPVLVSFIDRDERYRLVNKTYEDWFGKPRETIVGQTIREVLGEEAYAVRKPQSKRRCGARMFASRPSPRERTASAARPISTICHALDWTAGWTAFTSS